MKKGKIFVFIIWSVICILWCYSIFSGTLLENIKYRKENTTLANQIINTIKSLNADYEVINGRKGGIFSFKVTLSKIKNQVDIVQIFMDSTGFGKIKSMSKSIIFCERKSGLRFTYLDEITFVLEYERDLSECVMENNINKNSIDKEK